MRVLPEGSYDRLLEFLRLYRDAVQMVVDRIWGINEGLSEKRLHRLFYDDLELGLEHTTLRRYTCTLRA
jgi:putative transposase